MTMRYMHRDILHDCMYTGMYVLTVCIPVCMY